MNIAEQNVPKSYQDFMAKKPQNQMITIEREDGRDYDIYAYDMLLRNNPYDKKSPPNYQYLSYAELDYKPLEGDAQNIDIEILRKSFVFGNTDSGKLFFHPDTHAVYVLFLDLYVEKIADSFDAFLENSEIIDEWKL